MAGEFWQGQERLGAVRLGMAWQAWSRLGTARQGAARFGMGRQGLAGSGMPARVAAWPALKDFGPGVSAPGPNARKSQRNPNQRITDG